VDVSLEFLPTLPGAVSDFATPLRGFTQNTWTSTGRRGDAQPQKIQNFLVACVSLGGILEKVDPNVSNPGALHRQCGNSGREPLAS
jgi:hypothetical protein